MSPSALTPQTRETFWRTLQTFSLTRIVIGLVLLAYLGLNARRGFDLGDQFLNWETCVAYVGIAVVFAVLSFYWRRRFLSQLLIQIAVDISAVSILYVGAGGAKSGLAILYLFPLAGCAILTSLLLASFFAAVATLILLAEAGYRLFSLSGEEPISRAGLYGAAFFATAFVLNRLAAKLIKQEDLATRRGRELRVQEAINRLIIADMEDGILVVDRATRLLAVNPAVERMLGLSVEYGQARRKLIDIPSLAPIAEAFAAWIVLPVGQATAPASSAFVVIKPGDDLGMAWSTTISRDTRRETTIHLKLRFARVRATGLGADRIVIFLQDVSKIENRAQELKLASMGRLTASIAHEVRNPLSAIAHAASLLGEEVSDPVQTRLLTIVGDNVKRLNRMIEDILKLSRKAQVEEEPLALTPFFAELLAEFRQMHDLDPEFIRLGDMALYKVRFDPLHLREVVVNLLTNALRYASGRPGSIRIEVVADITGRLELHVQDDGPPIKPAVRAHLFEPFYTTSSKGTGLGLYLARELCLNNGATLDYEYRLDGPGEGGNEPSGRFVITFASPD